MKQIATVLLLISLALVASATSAVSNSFISDLIHSMVHDKSTENVIFSPVAIKSVLALTYLGAASSTAAEIETVLQLSTSSKEEVAKEFSELLEKTKNSDTAKLKIANRIYVAEQYSLAPKFNEIASKYFDAAAENIQFSDATIAANKINAWVENETHNKIQNMIDPSSLTEATAAILVNAIYFKGDWVIPFAKSSTYKGNFSVNTTHQVVVDMMSASNDYRYAELGDLNATALELPYKDTDLSMLIILPNQLDGLADLETKLKDVDLMKISNNLTIDEVDITVPKFKFDFTMPLKNILQKLGLNSMFSVSADFSELLASSSPLRVSEVNHKAFIEVTEESTEAAGAASSKHTFLSYSESFFVNHPFFFAIKDSQNLYFVGHVANF